MSNAETIQVVGENLDLKRRIVSNERAQVEAAELADELKAFAGFYHDEVDPNCPFEPWLNHIEFINKRKFPRVRELFLGKESGK